MTNMPYAVAPEIDVALAREQTRTLIAESAPVLEDLRHVLSDAADLLARLERTSEEEGQDDRAP